MVAVVLLALALLTSAWAGPTPNDESALLQQLYSQLSRERRAQLGAETWPESVRTVKTRRAPSLDNNYQWESMMQSLDNLRKPRFG